MSARERLLQRLSEQRMEDAAAEVLAARRRGFVAKLEAERTNESQRRDVRREEPPAVPSQRGKDADVESAGSQNRFARKESEDSDEATVTSEAVRSHAGGASTRLHKSDGDAAQLAPESGKRPVSAGRAKQRLEAQTDVRGAHALRRAEAAAPDHAPESRKAEERGSRRQRGEAAPRPERSNKDEEPARESSVSRLFAAKEDGAVEGAVPQEKSRSRRQEAAEPDWTAIAEDLKKPRASVLSKAEERASEAAPPRLQRVREQEETTSAKKLRPAQVRTPKRKPEARHEFDAQRAGTRWSGALRTQEEQREEEAVGGRTSQHGKGKQNVATRRTRTVPIATAQPEPRRARTERRYSKGSVSAKRSGSRLMKHRGSQREKRKVSAARLHANAASTTVSRALDGAAPATGALPDPLFEAVATPVGLYPPPVAALPALNTQGPFILKPECAAVALRGVTVAGFDALASVETAAGDLSLDDVCVAVLQRLWNVNLVRIPLLAQTVNGGNGTLSAADVLSALDHVVAQLASAGLYALLAVEAAPAQSTTPPHPDDNTAAALQTLATHFATNTGVLYEIFATAAPLASDWPQNAQVLIGTIRRQSPAAMVFVNTGNGGVDYAQFPLLFPTGDPVFNIVYTISAAAGGEPCPEEGVLATLAETYPVCASIWADDPGGTSGYVADILGRYGVHWAASGWNADPLLVGNAGAHDFSATAWGLTVQRAVSYPIRPYLQSVTAPDNDTGVGPAC